jgi:hypothetical protein
MDTKNEQSVGQTHENGQSQGVAAVASGSAEPHPSRKTEWMRWKIATTGCSIREAYDSHALLPNTNALPRPAKQDVGSGA